MRALKIKIEDGIALVTLDKPPLNLFDYSVYDEFRDTFNELSDREDVAVVILNAAGKNFTAGNEMDQLSKVGPDNVERHYEIVGNGLGAIYNCKKPTIAAIQGFAVGAGLAAAAGCDVIVAADDASFFIPEVTVGIIGATEFLSLLAPKKMVRYYAYTGKPIPAYKLYEWGSILELVPKKELTQTAYRIAREFLDRTCPLALSYTKQAMNDHDNERLYEKFVVEDYKYGKEFVKTEDYRECAKAFFEKRKPVYKNK